jgi:hypothetical protein
MPKQKLDPLPSAAFQILLSLADETLHGYGIMRQVEQQTGGRMRCGFKFRKWSGTPNDIYSEIPDSTSGEDRLQLSRANHRTGKADPKRECYRIRIVEFSFARAADRTARGSDKSEWHFISALVSSESADRSACRRLGQVD